MKIEQDFVLKTLNEMTINEFLEMITEGRFVDAYRILDSRWTSYGMAAMARRVCLFHSFDLNRREINDVVEAAIAELYDWVGDCEERYDEIRDVDGYRY